MMMKAIHKGGIPSYYSRKRERLLRRCYPLDRNPGGYFEPLPEEKFSLGFPLQAKGMAIKILAPWEWLGRMAVYEYKVLILRRNPIEIEASVRKINEGRLLKQDRIVLRNYDSYINKGVALAWNRRDVVDVKVLEFDDILLEPFEALSSLDWPIKAKRAASVINLSLRTCAA